MQAGDELDDGRCAGGLDRDLALAGGLRLRRPLQALNMGRRLDQRGRRLDRAARCRLAQRAASLVMSDLVRWTDSDDRGPDEDEQDDSQAVPPWPCLIHTCKYRHKPLPCQAHF